MHAPRPARDALLTSFIVALRHNGAHELADAASLRRGKLREGVKALREMVCSFTQAALQSSNQIKTHSRDALMLADDGLDLTRGRMCRDVRPEAQHACEADFASTLHALHSCSKRALSSPSKRHLPVGDSYAASTVDASSEPEPEAEDVTYRVLGYQPSASVPCLRFRVAGMVETSDTMDVGQPHDVPLAEIPVTMPQPEALPSPTCEDVTVNSKPTSSCVITYEPASASLRRSQSEVLADYLRRKDVNSNTPIDSLCPNACVCNGEVHDMRFTVVQTQTIVIFTRCSFAPVPRKGQQNPSLIPLTSCKSVKKSNLAP